MGSVSGPFLGSVLAPQRAPKTRQKLAQKLIKNGLLNVAPLWGSKLGKMSQDGSQVWPKRSKMARRRFLKTCVSYCSPTTIGLGSFKFERGALEYFSADQPEK